MNAYQQPKTGIGMGIPIPVLILIGVTIIVSAVARKHRFGRHVFAWVETRKVPNSRASTRGG